MKLFSMLYVGPLILLLASSAELFASDCTPIDHSSKMPPIRDQKGTGWCYAFATADLLSFEVGQPISGIGVAIAFQRGPSRELFLAEKGLNGFASPVTGGLYDLFVLGLAGEEYERGGNASAGLQSGISYGSLCLEEELPQFIPFPAMSGEMHGNVSSAQWLRSLRNHLQQNSVEDRNILPVGTPYCTRTEGSMINIVPQMQLDDFRRITRAIMPGDDVLGKFYEGACQRKVYPNRNLKVQSTNRSGDGENVLAALNAQLERSPATISYYAQGLADADRDVSGERNNHVSVITGRRYNPSTHACEYRLRNSWGADCEGYDSEFKCEGGYAWLSETQVRRMATNISGYTSP